jgi:trigger factor
MAGGTAPVPGFAEQIVGMKAEEEKEFKLTFPADYSNKEFADKEGQFKVRLNEIKQEVLPELTDEFAKQVGAEFATVAAVRERAATDLKKRLDDDARLAFENKVLQAVVDGANVEFPEVLTDTEIHRLMEQRFRTRDEVEAYLKATGKTEDELHEELHTELKDVAAERVKRGLILGQVAEEEELKVPSEEIDAEVKRLLESSTGNKENLEKALNREDTRESIQETLLTRKTIERLTAIARGEAEAAKEKEGGK